MRGLREVRCIWELYAHRLLHLVDDALDDGVAGPSGFASGRVLCGALGKKVGLESPPAGPVFNFTIGNMFVSLGARRDRINPRRSCPICEVGLD